MIRYFQRPVLVATALLCSVSFISVAHAQSVQDAVKSAIMNHPQVEQAKARLGIAEENTQATRSGLFPEVSVGLTAGRIYGDNATSRGLTVSRGAAYSGLGEGNASLQQPIFDGFETVSRIKASQSEKKSASLQLQDVREQIAFQTVQAYLNVLQSRSILLRLQAQESKVNDYFERIKANVEDGGGDEAELQQAKEVRVMLNGFVADYTGQLRNAESQYIALTGEDPLADLSVPVVDVSVFPEMLEDAIALAKTDHPAVRASLETVNAAGFDVEAEKGLLYPEVVGELSYLKSDKREEIGGEVEDGRAVVRMSWGFETGGGQYARIKQRKYEYAETLAREKEIKRQIERDVRLAYAERDVARKRLKTQAEREALSQKLFETYESQFEGGRVKLLQLMQADNQLFNTEIEKTVYQYRLLAAQYGIVASLGKLQDTLFETAARESYQSNTQEAGADEPKE